MNKIYFDYRKQVLTFKIEHRASKEDDEMASEFINEIIANGSF